MIGARESLAAGGHIPVLLDQVIEILRPRDGGIYVDGTFGRGGYSRALLDAASCRVWGIDRDPDAVRHGNEMADNYGRRLRMVQGRFGDMARLVEDKPVDGVALDLGVSSPQLDDPSRGFSFLADGPLDLRMERRGPSAADVVNHTEERALADLIYQYGEERRARRVAREIVAARRIKPIERTLQLAEIVARAVPKARDGLHPATRTFQALRIYVNDELAELERGLAAAEALLGPGGRLAVVAFHSLEDRIVKDFLRLRSGGAARPSRHMPMTDDPDRAPTFKILTRKAIRPNAAEAERNPRARSARLRAGERTTAPIRIEEAGS